MSVSKHCKFKVKVFKGGQLAKAVRSGLVRPNFEVPTYTLFQPLPDGTNLTKEIREDQELAPVCDLTGSQLIAKSRTKDGKSLYLSMYNYSTDAHALYIHASADSHEELEGLLSAVLGILSLEEAADPSSSEVSVRLQAVEEAILKQRRLRVFLSYRFTQNSEEPALRLRQFLNLLGVDVLTGASYEPRRVSEKVLSRLREPHDAVILLITTDGESMWTRDEIASALHGGIAVIPLVEDKARFEPGLFADLEYITFASGHIGDAFIKILEAIRFLEQQKPTGTGQAGGKQDDEPAKPSGGKA